ncbi:uncharacterized protein CLUP02_03058 [Colletotrichum lupini]|uniref:Uncharacterized protein n=1 Tax=Colletotrichum lupini TaxID=145971 RepID=A0A9Q8WBU4_9PEZI|nr:uncharacterized protein CLUP02_03058 [Colletotrichum lupini]UQC77589.1 hypothetical protein CLUP02_03058 [Colletotrichum lupini]
MRGGNGAETYRRPPLAGLVVEIELMVKTKVTSSDDHANGSDQFYYPPYPAVLGSSSTTFGLDTGNVDQRSMSVSTCHYETKTGKGGLSQPPAERQQQPSLRTSQESSKVRHPHGMKVHWGSRGST